MGRHSNSSVNSANMRTVYTESFDGSPDSLRMALLNPLTVNGVRSQWYGVGGSSALGYSHIPTVGYVKFFSLPPFFSPSLQFLPFLISYSHHLIYFISDSSSRLLQKR